MLDYKERYRVELIESMARQIKCEIKAIDRHLKMIEALSLNELKIKKLNEKVINKRVFDVFREIIRNFEPDCFFFTRKYTKSLVFIMGFNGVLIETKAGNIMSYPQYFKELDFFSTEAERFSWSEFKSKLADKETFIREMKEEYEDHLSNLEENLNLHDKLWAQLKELRENAGTIFSTNVNLR